MSGTPFQAELLPFLDRLFADLEAQGLAQLVRPLQMDHVCYRVESETQYQELKNEFAGLGTLLSEALIAGRLICTYRLQDPWIWRDRRVELVELPQPKTGSPYGRGFEHAEFVWPGDLAQLQQRFASLPWDTRSMRPGLNPELALKLARTRVKFHPLPLDEVIRREGAAEGKT